VGVERGPLSLVSTIEELLVRNSSGSGLENREYGRGDPLPWPRDTLYPQKLVLTSPESSGRSVGIVHLRIKATEFVCLFFFARVTTQSKVWNVFARSDTETVGSKPTFLPCLCHPATVYVISFVQNLLPQQRTSCLRSRCSETVAVYRITT
jgi:hypothetical protein